MNEIILNNKEFKLLSNYSNHRIGYGLDGNNWKSVCHFYHYHKFGISKKSLKIKQEIFSANTPQEAEIIGTKKYQYPKNIFQRIFLKNRFVEIDGDWDTIKYKLLKKAILAKVIQYVDVRNCLMSTNNSLLVFHSSNTFWGINDNGIGQNNLGLIFTEIRNSFLKEGRYQELALAPNPIWKKYPQYDQSGFKQGCQEYDYMQFYYWYEGLSELGKKEYQKLNPQPHNWSFY